MNNIHHSHKIHGKDVSSWAHYSYGPYFCFVLNELYTQMNKTLNLQLAKFFFHMFVVVSGLANSVLVAVAEFV